VSGKQLGVGVEILRVFQHAEFRVVHAAVEKVTDGGGVKVMDNGVKVKFGRRSQSHLRSAEKSSVADCRRIGVYLMLADGTCCGHRMVVPLCGVG